MKKKYENIDDLDNLFDISNIENRGEIERDNVESISKELAHVKCPNCGYMNFELTKKCTKCRYDLDYINKSCPKCGRINANAVKRCECGFNFNKRKSTLLGNLIITLIIMVLLFVVMKYYGDVVKKYDMVIKVFFIYIAFVFVCKMFISSNPNDDLAAENDILDKYKRKSNPRVVRNLLIILGAVVAIGFLVYYYYFR